MRRHSLLYMLFVFGCQPADNQAPSPPCTGPNCAAEAPIQWDCPTSENERSEAGGTLIERLGRAGRTCNPPSSETRFTIDEQRVYRSGVMTGPPGILEGATVIAAGTSRNAEYTIEAVLLP